MTIAAQDEKIYPVTKLATLVDSLRSDGISSEQAMASVGLTEADLHSPATKVSINQILQCCRNASHLSSDPGLAFRVGSRFHLSTYGMYGFAMLSSTDFRTMIRFAVHYHQLAAPVVDISLKEEADRSGLVVAPIIQPANDIVLYRFLAELHIAIYVSLLRDVMGPTFAPAELQFKYSPAAPSPSDRKLFGCPAMFDQPENTLRFDRHWLNEPTQAGNELTYLEVVELCKQLVEEMQHRTGMPGAVREAILTRLARPANLETIAHILKIPGRTLRRRLRDDGTSFRQIYDELRKQMAIKYLYDTSLTTDDIALCLGFSDATNFRHAFRRWTGTTPHDFRTPRCATEPATAATLHPTQTATAF